MTDENTYDTVLDAVRAARRIQDREHEGYGVGVSFDFNDTEWAWVQWCLTSDGDTVWNADVLELCFPASRDAVATVLRSRGYEPDETLSGGHNAHIWRLSDEQKSWETEDEMVAYIVDQVRAIGGADGMTFTAYP